MSATSDTSYSEPPEVFDDETPDSSFVTVNAVETRRTPSTDEKVIHAYLTFLIGSSSTNQTSELGARSSFG